jgi:hypothetical protein
MLRLALVLCLCGVPLWAAPARVSSGEHEGFTRVVVDLGRAAAWSLGRTEDGYAMQIEGEPAQYDLSAAFKVIGRQRLAGLAVDASTGALLVSLGCNCYAMPFEFRPGTIVLDLRDGPPPANSPFEAPVLLGAAEVTEGNMAEAVAAGPNPMTLAWVDSALAARDSMASTTPAMAPQGDDMSDAEAEFEPETEPVDEPQALAEALPEVAVPLSPLLDPGLAPLRDELMRELSRGVAQGVVQMELPKGAKLPKLRSDGAPNTQARVDVGQLAGLPQVRVDRAGDDKASLAAKSASCPTDVQLDLASWGDDRPIWEQFSEARAGLAGEFDLPDEVMIERAVKFYLFIGFGQEAIGMIDGFDVDAKDAPLWANMAAIIDEIKDPTGAFTQMATCDSSAALWALLGEGVDGGEGAVNLIAVQRSFSALPSRMRQTLGPRVIERLLAMNAREAVDVVANAIRRPGEIEDRGVVLMEAEVAAQAGDHEKASEILQPLLQDPGPEAAEALAATIEANAAQNLPITPETLIAIEAHAMERDGGPDAPKFRRARVLALALTGDFAKAFHESPQDGPLQADLWRLLAALGTDAALLEQAAVAPGGAAPLSARRQSAEFAQRFLDLGLPDQALIWLAGAESLDHILAAKIALGTHDGLSALAYLKGLETEEAQELRLRAQGQTGDDLAMAADLAQAGDAAGAASALARARDWAALAEDGPAEWQGAARALTGLLAPSQSVGASGAESSSGAAPGPLAEGTALADQAQQTRAALQTLLASVPPVEPLRQ